MSCFSEILFLYALQYDPIAYRLEPLIDPEWTVPPVLLAHHKGRKRIHLELVDGFSKAADFKQKMFGVFRNTMTSITSLMSSYTLVLKIENIIVIILFFIEILRPYQ